MENDSVDITSPIWSDMLGRVHALQACVLMLAQVHPELLKAFIAQLPEVAEGTKTLLKQTQHGQLVLHGFDDQIRRILQGAEAIASQID